MKTAELTKAALDWAVAKCKGELDEQDYYLHESTGAFMLERGEVSWAYSPSTNWSQGGPIIEHEDISFRKYHKPNSSGHGKYYAKVCRESGEKIWWTKRDMTGPTPLIAAMRCYVASKLGDEVEIPEELK
jgi:hypothetical protein